MFEQRFCGCMVSSCPLLVWEMAKGENGLQTAVEEGKNIVSTGSVLDPTGLPWPLGLFLTSLLQIISEVHSHLMQGLAHRWYMN